MPFLHRPIKKLHQHLTFARAYHFVKLNRNFDGKIIDLRTDTVAKPTKSMMNAIYNAEVGDDFMKECPTVLDLEHKCAELFGMEAAMFVSTTTMGNLLSIMGHCQGRGQEVIVGKTQHLFKLEQSNLAQFGAIASNMVQDEADGTINLDVLEKAIRTPSFFNQETLSNVICLENSHNQSGGTPLSLSYLKEVGKIAQKHGLKVHVDGARLYNAAVSLNVDVKDTLTHADSVSMSLAKGLGSPMGAIIGGSKDLIQKALRIRTGLGGSTCMSGFMAAAAIHALGTAKETIKFDHKRAKLIAKMISNLNSDIVFADVDQVKTNIVLMKTKNFNAVDLSEMLAKKGVLTSVIDDSTIRIVTHLDISTEDIDMAIHLIEKTTQEIQIIL